jgi:hypothetical protein
MRWVFIITGFLLFLSGLMISLDAASGLRSPLQEVRAGATYSILLGIVFVVVGFGFAAGGAYLEQLRKQEERRQRSRDRLRNLFLQLLQDNEGQVSVVQFAVAAGLDGMAARAYLDEQARSLNAGYNISQEGKLTYYFDLEQANLEALPSDQWD